MKKPTTKAEMLEVIREFFNDTEISYLDRKEIWHILTALRGPDLGGDDSKLATTLQIRAAVIGLEQTDLWSSPFFRNDNQQLLKVRKEMTIKGDHFWGHVRMAFSYLGLAWDAVNPPLEKEESLNENPS